MRFFGLWPKNDTRSRCRSAVKLTKLQRYRRLAKKQRMRVRVPISSRILSERLRQDGPSKSLASSRSLSGNAHHKGRWTVLASPSPARSVRHSSAISRGFPSDFYAPPFWHHSCLIRSRASLAVRARARPPRCWGSLPRKSPSLRGVGLTIWCSMHS